MLTGDATAALGAVLLALALDALFGEPEWLCRRLRHPVALMGALSNALERRLLRAERSAAAQARAGALAAVLVIGAAAAAGLALHALVARGLPAGGWAVEGLLISTLVAQRSLHDHVARVVSALERGLEEGRAAVAHIVGRDPQSLDGPGVARAAIESTAENFSDGVVAPVFWAVLFGLPGIAAYKAVNTLDSMIGHRTPRHLHYGRFAARLDDAANLAPARLAALLLLAAALALPGADARRGWRAVRRDAPRHRSPNAGWPEAALAGSLGVRLAGPRRYAGRLVEDAWMGDGRAGATAGDIRRALHVFVIACAILAVTVAAALLAAVAAA